MKRHLRRLCITLLFDMTKAIRKMKEDFDIIIQSKPLSDNDN